MFQSFFGFGGGYHLAKSYVLVMWGQDHWTFQISYFPIKSTKTNASGKTEQKTGTFLELLSFICFDIMVPFSPQKV